MSEGEQPPSTRHHGRHTSEDPDMDHLIDTFPAAGPSRQPKKEVTYADFAAMIDSTPLFMREPPKDGETNDVIEGLRALLHEGEGDGACVLSRSCCRGSS